MFLTLSSDHVQLLSNRNATYEQAFFKYDLNIYNYEIDLDTQFYKFI